MVRRQRQRQHKCRHSPSPRPSRDERKPRHLRQRRRRLTPPHPLPPSRQKIVDNLVEKAEIRGEKEQRQRRRHRRQGSSPQPPHQPLSTHVQVVARCSKICAGALKDRSERSTKHKDTYKQKQEKGKQDARHDKSRDAQPPPLSAPKADPKIPRVSP